MNETSERCIGSHGLSSFNNDKDSLHISRGTLTNGFGGSCEATGSTLDSESNLVCPAPANHKSVKWPTVKIGWQNVGRQIRESGAEKAGRFVFGIDVSCSGTCLANSAPASPASSELQADSFRNSIVNSGANSVGKGISVLRQERARATYSSPNSPLYCASEGRDMLHNAGRIESLRDRGPERHSSNEKDLKAVIFPRSPLEVSSSLPAVSGPSWQFSQGHQLNNVPSLSSLELDGIVPNLTNTHSLSFRLPPLLSAPSTPASISGEAHTDSSVDFVVAAAVATSRATTSNSNDTVTEIISQVVANSLCSSSQHDERLHENYNNSVPSDVPPVTTVPVLSSTPLPADLQPLSSQVTSVTSTSNSLASPPSVIEPSMTVSATSKAKPSSKGCSQICQYAIKDCKQRSINGYSFCIRHILEEPTAPYKRCQHIRKQGTPKEIKCANAVPLNQGSDTHLIMMGMKERNPKKKKSKVDSTSSHPFPEAKSLSSAPGLKSPLLDQHLHASPRPMNDVGLLHDSDFQNCYTENGGSFMLSDSCSESRASSFGSSINSSTSSVYNHNVLRHHLNGVGGDATAHDYMAGKPGSTNMMNPLVAAAATASPKNLAATFRDVNSGIIPVHLYNEDHHPSSSPFLQPGVSSSYHMPQTFGNTNHNLSHRSAAAHSVAATSPVLHHSSPHQIQQPPLASVRHQAPSLQQPPPQATYNHSLELYSSSLSGQSNLPSYHEAVASEGQQRQQQWQSPPCNYAVWQQQPHQKNTNEMFYPHSSGGIGSNLALAASAPAPPDTGCFLAPSGSVAMIRSQAGNVIPRADYLGQTSAVRPRSSFVQVRYARESVTVPSYQHPSESAVPSIQQPKAPADLSQPSAIAGSDNSATLLKQAVKNEQGKKVIRLKQKRKRSSMVGNYRKIVAVSRMCKMLEDLDADNNDLFPLGLEPSSSDSEADDEAGMLPTASTAALFDVSSDEESLELTTTSGFSSPQSSAPGRLSKLRRHLYLMRRSNRVFRTNLQRTRFRGGVMAAASRYFANSVGSALTDRCASLKHAAAVTKASNNLDARQQCLYEMSNIRCTNEVLPLSNFCAKHIKVSVNQQLFHYCSETGCGMPTFDLLNSQPKCARHNVFGDLDVILRPYCQKDEYDSCLRTFHCQRHVEQLASSNANTSKFVGNVTELGAGDLAYDDRDQVNIDGDELNFVEHDDMPDVLTEMMKLPLDSDLLCSTESIDDNDQDYDMDDIATSSGFTGGHKADVKTAAALDHNWADVAEFLRQEGYQASSCPSQISVNGFVQNYTASSAADPMFQNYVSSADSRDLLQQPWSDLNAAPVHGGGNVYIERRPNNVSVGNFITTMEPGLCDVSSYGSHGNLAKLQTAKQNNVNVFQ